MTWERRYEQAGRIRIEESGSAYEPVGVGLKSNCSFTSIHAILASWERTHDMVSAFTTTAPLICIHIQRQVPGGGRWRRSPTSILIEDEIAVPVFQGQELSLGKVAYTCVACLVHEGNLSQGHYRAILRQAQNKWMWCDDNHIAVPSLEVVQKGIMLCWLAKSDLLHRQATRPTLPKVSALQTDLLEWVREPHNLMGKDDLIGFVIVTIVYYVATGCFEPRNC